MGIMESLEGLAGGSNMPETQKVTGGLMKALDEHPGGLTGLLDHLKQNGMQEHVDNWASGQQTALSPDQVQQGLGSTGLIEKVAQYAGVSPQIAQTVLARVLPMVISHFSSGGQQGSPQSGFAGMVNDVLGKFK
jgi:uncharacterized protein YidB (DUF937 family)